MSFLVGNLVFGWVEPNAGPPANNVLPPVLTSSLRQGKQGDLGALTFYDTAENSYYLDPNGKAVLKGPISINKMVSAAGFSLDVNGQIATPYKLAYPGSPPMTKSLDFWKSDVNKDGFVNSMDLELVVDMFGNMANWSKIVGVDNLGNFLYGRDMDLDGNGVVNMVDIQIVLDNYRDFMTPYLRQTRTGDINKDGRVDFWDLSYVLMMWTKTSGDSEWTNPIGYTQQGNIIKGKDTDLFPDNVINMNDINVITSNYSTSDKLYHFMSWSHPLSGQPAAEFSGDTIVYGGYLQAKKDFGASKPTASDCDDALEVGRFVIGSTAHKLYVCMPNGIVPPISYGWYETTLTPVP